MEGNIQALMTQAAWADMHMAQTWPLPWQREEEEELREEILSSFFWKHSEKMREMEDRQNKDRRKSRFKMRDKHKTNSTEQTYLRWNRTLTSRFARAFFRTSRVRDTVRQTSSLKLWWHHNTKTHHHMSKLTLKNLKLLKQIKRGSVIRASDKRWCSKLTHWHYQISVKHDGNKALFTWWD